MGVGSASTEKTCELCVESGNSLPCTHASKTGAKRKKQRRKILWRMTEHYKGYIKHDWL